MGTLLKITLIDVFGFFLYFISYGLPEPFRQILCYGVRPATLLLCFYLGAKQFRISVGLGLLALELLLPYLLFFLAPVLVLFLFLPSFLPVFMPLVQFDGAGVNLQVYSGYMLEIFLNSIVPLAVGLTYSIIAFMKDKQSRTLIPEWPLAGGLFVFLGVYGIFRSPMLNIFSAVVRVACVLWMLAGILFVILPVFRMRVRRESLEEILWYDYRPSFEN